MALKRYEKYPNRWDPATPEQPQGAFKNRTTTVSKDGSFIEKDWANDWSGFFGAALGKAGIVPNGEVDTALSSQYYEAFRTFFYNPENKPDPVDIGAADRSHGHQIANVNGLQEALDSKSANGHKHNISDINSLQANLDSKAPNGYGLGTSSPTEHRACGFFGTGTSSAGTPANGSGFQSVYNQNRRAQIFLTTSGDVFSRFSLSEDTVDSSTPWAKHFTTLNKPSTADVVGLQSTLDSKAPNGYGLGTGGRNVDANKETLGGFWRDTTLDFAGVTLPYDGTPAIRALAVTGGSGLRVGGRIKDNPFSWIKVYSEAEKPSAADVGAYTQSECNSKFIAGVRLGTRTAVKFWGGAGFNDTAGYVITSVINSNQDDLVDTGYARPIQYLLNGTWYTCSSV